MYGAASVRTDGRVRDQLTRLEAAGFGGLPVCLAKTPYSLSADASLKGAPEGFDVPLQEVRVAAGAGFVVALAGDIMTMPGLPRVPAANTIDITPTGLIEGLF